MYCMRCFLKSKHIKSRTFTDNNRRTIKKVMVLKKLLPNIATRGTYSQKELKVRWCVTWANIGVPSSDVPAEVELLHMIIERNVIFPELNYRKHHLIHTQDGYAPKMKSNLMVVLHNIAWHTQRFQVNAINFKRKQMVSSDILRAVPQWLLAYAILVIKWHQQLLSRSLVRPWPVLVTWRIVFSHLGAGFYWWQFYPI